MIPVKNIYYMLSYAFSALRSKGYASIAAEDFDNAEDLLAAILAKGIIVAQILGQPFLIPSETPAVWRASA